MSEGGDTVETQTLSTEQVAETVDALTERIHESVVASTGETAFVGIYTRGVTLANRVAEGLRARGRDLPVGTLDISLYRDDLDTMGSDLPRLESSHIPFSLEGTRVILFDDVIFTGRTIRAALDGLSDYGRPAKIELAVLVDRGWREIPIQPDYVGSFIQTDRDERVSVRFHEDDGRDGVYLRRKQPEMP